MNFRQWLENIGSHELDWAHRHKVEITPDGKFIMYHGTRNQTAKLIRQQGFFKSGTFFTEDPKYALEAQDGPMGTQGSRRGKMVVMKVKIDPALLYCGHNAQARTVIPVEETV